MAIGRINATLTGVQPGGLAKIVPTSVTVGSGSGSVNGNGTVSFSSVSSVSLSNILSSSYEYYRVVINTASSAASANLNLRFRENVTDKSASYYGAGRSNQFNATQADFNLQNNSAQLQINTINTSIGGTVLDIFRPDATQGQIFGMAYTRPNDAWVSYAGRNSDMTNFTGISLVPSTGTITGTLSVYGYAQ
jgi:hypothetical protein